MKFYFHIHGRSLTLSKKFIDEKWLHARCGTVSPVTVIICGQLIKPCDYRIKCNDAPDDDSL